MVDSINSISGIAKKKRQKKHLIYCYGYIPYAFKTNHYFNSKVKAVVDSTL